MPWPFTKYLASSEQKRGAILSKTAALIFFFLLPSVMGDPWEIGG